MSATVEERLRTYSSRLDQAVEQYDARSTQPSTDPPLHIPELTPDHRSGRRRFALAAVACLVVSGGVATVIVRRDPSSPSVSATSPGVTTTTTVPITDAPAKGDPAVWFINSHDDATSASRSFTAQVTRLSCNGGVTGAVLPPTVEKLDTRIVVTFTVEHSPRGGTCQGNDRVPVVVDLGEAIGDRQLVDGACGSGSAAATTTFCVDSSVRWKP